MTTLAPPTPRMRPKELSTFDGEGVAGAVGFGGGDDGGELEVPPPGGNTANELAPNASATSASASSERILSANRIAAAAFDWSSGVVAADGDTARENLIVVVSNESDEDECVVVLLTTCTANRFCSRSECQPGCFLSSATSIFFSDAVSGRAWAAAFVVFASVFSKTRMKELLTTG